jgi:outer membrane protein OmpA-like peptidoglycan-associated protein
MRPLRVSLLHGLLAAALLAGCASTPPGAAPAEAVPGQAAAPPAAAASSIPERRTAAASSLAVERQWLASWFKGTPVVVAQRSDGAVTVDVPREFCFDPGRDAVKPALAAVLDKVAESLRRTAVAEVGFIAAPGDPSSPPALALQRAARVHDYLRARGVAAARLAKPSPATGATVHLRLDAVPPA